MTEGWVYVISNPAMPELVKVGFTTKHPKERARELNGTGVPDSYVAEYAVRVQSPKELESAVHDHLRQLGLDAGKEWFKCRVEQAVAAILEIGREEIKDHYRAEDEDRRLELLKEQRIEQERARVRTEILERLRQEKEARPKAQRSREKARLEARDAEVINRHEKQINDRRAATITKIESRYPSVLLEDVDRVRLWFFFFASVVVLFSLASFLPAWGPTKWLGVPFVAGTLSLCLRELIVHVRWRSTKGQDATRKKQHLLGLVDEIIPYASYDWYAHRVKGESPRFLVPLPEEAVRRVSIDGEVTDGKGWHLRGFVHNANSNWVISGVDIRTPEGYSPPSVRLPMCLLPGERVTFNIQLLRHRASGLRHRGLKSNAEEIDVLQRVGSGGSFGYRVSQSPSSILEIVGHERAEEVAQLDLPLTAVMMGLGRSYARKHHERDEGSSSREH